MPVVNTPEGDYVITAAEAARHALITYRQLDHWARRGWVTPSVQSGSGRGGRRLYSTADVLRLSALRHFAKAGWQINDLGDQVNKVRLDDAAWLVVGTGSGVKVCGDDDELHQLITREELFSVYPLGPLRAQFAGPALTAEVVTAVPTSMKRRTA